VRRAKAIGHPAIHALERAQRCLAPPTGRSLTAVPTNTRGAAKRPCSLHPGIATDHLNRHFPYVGC
jgi:hypothetical protein